MLRIFNTLSNKKEVFKSIYYRSVNIYVCGVTISNYCHIGHGRTFCFFDILVRYLNYLGYKCNYIRNITDVSNDFLKSKLLGKYKINDFITNMITKMSHDFKILDFIEPNYEPRTMKHISIIISFISKLIYDGFAYININGDVCCDIKKIIRDNRFIKNKKLSNNNFVLWKLNRFNKYFGWYSPWGFGIPGWHIGCSVLSNEYLHNMIDIHGGGTDLIFPHHVNEFYLSKYLFDKKNFINYFMHTGLVLTNKSKMSKSKKNFFLLNDLLKKYHPDVIKFFFLSTHYRKTLSFNSNNLINSRLSITKFYLTLRNLNLNLSLSNKDLLSFRDLDKDFCCFMDDDFNTPKVFSLFFEILREINFLKNRNFLLASKMGIKMCLLANIIGLLNNKNFFLYSGNYKIRKIENLIYLRNKARKCQNWVLSDLIRDKLYKLNVLIKDCKDKTEWYFKY